MPVAKPPYLTVIDLEGTMRPLHRNHVNKAKSARKFRKQTMRTKGANINGPQRGGWRF